MFSDTLLCHDDELEGRRIAFVLYLVPPWEEGDGGLLDLFDRDGESADTAGPSVCWHGGSLVLVC